MTALADIAGRFDFNTDKMIHMVIKDLQGDQWLHRNGDANHAQWLLGHLATTRRWAIRLLGGQSPELDWEKFFGAGDRPSPESDAVPPETLAKAYTEAGQALSAHLRGMSEADAQLEVSTKFPDGSKTRAGAAGFLLGHEWYHLGQLGFIRRTVGMQGSI